MKKVLIFLLSISLLFSQKAPLSVSLGNDWFPYFVHKDDTVIGLDIDLLSAVFDSAGVDYDFIKTPSARGLLYLKDGKRDVMVGASYTDERAEYAYYSIPYRDEEIALLVVKGDAKNYHLSSLKDIMNFSGLKLAAERGSWYGSEYGELLHDSLFQSHLSLQPSLEQRISMLLHRRVHIVIDDKFALLGMAHQMGVSDSVELHPYRPFSDSVHYIFSKKSVDSLLIHKINRAILLNHKSGNIKRIIQLYISSE